MKHLGLCIGMSLAISSLAVAQGFDYNDQSPLRLNRSIAAISNDQGAFI